MASPGRKALRLLAMLLLCFCFFFVSEAAADTREVTLLLSQSTQTSGNQPYKMDSRAYERDLTVPFIDGLPAFAYSRTNASVTYFCPCAFANGAVTLELPYAAAWTTVEVNGQLLTHENGVQATLGEDLTIRLASKNKRTVLHLTLTDIPVVCVEYAGSNLYENKGVGEITVYDPNYAANGREAMTTVCDMLIKYRGQSSLSYDKHNYSLDLVRYGGKYNLPLLGLRDDDDWILDGAMNDMLRIRNAVAMDLWSQFYALPWDAGNTGAIRGKPCELFINGRYAGLYSLNERIDRKQMGVDRQHGRIIRSVQAEASGVNLMAFQGLGKYPPTDSTIWYNMEIKYPQKEFVTPQTWDEMRDMLLFVAEADDQTFAQRVGEYLDVDNLAAYYVYVTAIGATGNMIKNLYFIMEDATAPDAKFLLVPWDVDGAFGRRNDSTKRDIDVLSGNRLFDRLIATNAGGFNQKALDWWARLGGDVLSYDNIMATFRKHYQPLAQSGAYDREAAAWPTFGAYKFNAASELDYIDGYMKSRYAFVSEYFAGDTFIVED